LVINFVTGPAFNWLLH